MKEKGNLEGASRMGVWAWWWIRSRKPGMRAEPPPMPPLAEWPKELFETFERLTGVSLNDVEFYDPPK